MHAANSRFFWRNFKAGLVSALVMSGALHVSALPEPVFYASFDETLTGVSRSHFFDETGRSLATPWGVEYEPGLIGKAVRMKTVAFGAGLRYAINDVFDPETRSVSIWYKPGTNASCDSMLMPVADGRSLALKGVGDEAVIEAASYGEWRHFVFTWDVLQDQLKQYLDGVLLDSAPFKAPLRFENYSFGAGLHGDSLLDELVLLDEALSAEQVKEIHEAYKKGVQPFQIPSGTDPYLPLDLSACSADRPALPQGVDWGLGVPDFRNDKRELFKLDGYWRIQPVEFGRRSCRPDKWFYVKIPSRWLPKGSEAALFDSALKPVTEYREKDVPAKRMPQGWDPSSARGYLEWAFSEYAGFFLERDFTPPPGSHGKQFILRIAGSHVNSTYDYTDVYVNGTHVGTIEFLWYMFPGDRYFNITHAVSHGESNRVTLVQGMRKPGLSDAALLEPPALEIIGNDMVVFDDAELITVPSVRKDMLGIRIPVANKTDKVLNLDVKALISDRAGEETLFTLGPCEFKLPPGFSGETSLWFNAENKFEYWDPANPVLYHVSLEVGSGGTLLDVTKPVRFGFREVWVEGSELLLNGKRLSIRGKSHGGMPYKKHEIDIMRAVGQNADRDMPGGFFNMIRRPGPTLIDTLSLADEEGWLSMYHCEGLSTQYPNDKDYLIRFKEAHVRQTANHPSVVLWQIWGGGMYTGPHGHPMQIGSAVSGDARENDYRFERIRYLSDVDPQRRPSYYYAAGVGAEVRAIMMSLGYSMPMQEVEEWVSYWAEHKPEPFIPVEQQIYSRPGYFWQRGSRESVVCEHHARFFGQKAYRKIENRHLEEWKDIGGNLWSTPEFWNDFYSEVYTRALRSWRTYGLSGYLFHASFFFQLLYEEGRLGGALTPFGETVKAANAPFIMYVAGPEKDFISKDHTFFSGETVKKSVVMINDSFKNVPGTLSWKIYSPAELEIGAGSRSMVVDHGGVVFENLAFKCPDVETRTALRIEAEFRAVDENIVLRDVFNAAIFPLQESGGAESGIGVFDETGATIATFDRLEIKYVQVKDARDFSGLKLLVIGRNDFASAARKLGGENLNKAVEAGMNVFVFEQMHRNVAGLVTEFFKTRRAFMPDRSSPLFGGLYPEDFVEWRGASTFLPPYLSWCEESEWRSGAGLPSKHGQGNSFGQGRFWHWGNRGMVNTFCYQKPHFGNFNILLENGFDVLYTPLVEFRKGRGRILFSQLDFVDAAGVDPAATLLFHRLLRDYSSGPTHEQAPIGYVGGPSGAGLLDLLKVEREDGFSGHGVTFVSLSEMDDRIALENYVKAGGTALVSIKSPADAEKLPVRVYVHEPVLASTEDAPPVLPAGVAGLLPGSPDSDMGLADDIESLLEDEDTALDSAAQDTGAKDYFEGRLQQSSFYFEKGVPDDPVFAGVSLSDLYYRVPLEKLNFAGVPDDTGKCGELIGVIPFGDGRIIYIQPDPELFDDPWQKSKIIRLYNTVLNNLGVKSMVSPDFTLVGGYGVQEEWLPGYAGRIKKLDERPMVYDSLLYQGQALDFDPDAHYVW